MKSTLGYVFLFVTKGYFCSILISNIIFVFLSFVVCLCIFFSATIKTPFLLFSNENTTFCLARTSVARGDGEKAFKRFPSLRMNGILFAYIAFGSESYGENFGIQIFIGLFLLCFF